MVIRLFHMSYPTIHFRYVVGVYVRLLTKAFDSDRKVNHFHLYRNA